MKITKVYLDLKEAKPEQRFWKDVWVLESEAFKDPLTFQLEYEPKDFEYLHELQQEIDDKMWKMQKLLEIEQENATLLQEENKLLREQIKNQEQINIQLREEIEKKDKIENTVRIELEKQHIQLERNCEGINDSKEKIFKIEQKLTKQPTVLSDTTFLSWIGESFLTVVSIPDGEYLYIQKTKITEKNEFVANEDDITISKIHVQDRMFTPPYTLKGTDAVSTPTATIDRTLVFIPI